MSTTETPADDAGRIAISEDWAATALGLLLLVLVLTGVIPVGLVP
ncbi:hypothetical protein GCM10010149_51780 [Nonomuraea roseoviolacea subsp. roseoviolacea]